MNWDDLRLLLELERSGSFLRAGSNLGLSPSTISRRLTVLDRDLETRLAERATDGCRLTEQGRELAELARGTARGLDNFRRASKSALKGKITISSGDAFAETINEVATEFLSQHPDCAIDMHIESRFAKVARGEADIAIRDAHLGEPSLIYRKLGSIPYGVFCTQECLRRNARHGGPAPLVALAPPFDQKPQTRAFIAAGLGQPVLRTSSFIALLDAARKGIGFAALPVILADGLVAAFPEVEIPDDEVYLVTRQSALKSDHIRRFWDALISHGRKALPGH